MRASLPHALAVAFIVGASPAHAAKEPACKQDSLEKLQAMAPQGFAIYRKIADKDFFTGWLDCDDAMFALPTAVHESVHHITADTDAFPLIDGSTIARPHETSRFFAPKNIAGQFASSDFVTTYLKPGSASSATDFTYLLDELNAYTHDLSTSVALEPLRKGEERAARDGLAALMAFVAIYVERAERSEPKTWAGLTSPKGAKTVTALWDQAEKVMARACRFAGFGFEDGPLIRQTCQAGPQSALRAVIGRTPVCPLQCLEGR